MKKIVIPVDFSPCSINAVNYASNLAHVLNADLELLYVHNTEITEPFHSIIQLKIKELIDRLKKSNVRAGYSIRHGDLETAIVDFAESKEADLVIMGTHGVTQAYDLMYGTNTSHLIRMKKLNVLMIPHNYKVDSALSKQPFILATDFSGLDYIPEFYVELLQKMKVDLEVFHVENKRNEFENQDELMYKMQDLEYIFEGVNVNFNSSFDYDLVESISEFAMNNQAQMVTMISHNRSFIDKIFHKSATEAMALYSTIPFMAIPDKKQELNMAGTW